MTKEINNTAPNTVEELVMQYDERAKKVLGYKVLMSMKG